MSVQLNTAVRIAPPSQLNGEWLVENIAERRRFRLSGDAAAVLVAASRRRGENELAEQVAASDPQRRPDAFWSRIIGALRRSGLIVAAEETDSDSRTAWAEALRAAWSRYGWHEAAEYHVLAYDYP